MKHYGAIILFALTLTTLSAQDVHFSQYYASPLTLNPALTGAFDGSFRINANYRDQWGAVTEQPYKTFSTGLDLRYGLGSYGRQYRDNIAVGVVFFTDRVPSYDFSTNKMMLSFAYHKALDPRNSQFLSVGFQGGVVQRSVNYEDLTFNDQFDGTTGYTFGSGEVLPDNNFAYADFNAGVNYSWKDPTTGLGFFLGGSVHHFSNPQVSFFETEETEYEGSRKLVRYSAQLSAQIPLTERLSVSPRAMANLQGPHFELNAGSNLRIQFGGYGTSAFHIGAYARPVRDIQNNIMLDAVVGMVGFEIDNVLFGFSYDAGVTSTAAVRNGQGSFEVSVAYLGAYQNEIVLCPQF